MPTSFDAQPIRVELYYRDDSGTTSSAGVRLPYGTTFAVARSFALALAQLVERVSDAVVEGVGIRLTLDFEDSASAQTGSNIERCGVFITESTVAEDRYLLQLPAIRTDRLESSGDWSGIAVNQADTNVAALVNLLLVGDGTVAPISLAGNDLTTLNAAYLQWRKPNS